MMMTNNEPKREAMELDELEQVNGGVIFVALGAAAAGVLLGLAINAGIDEFSNYGKQQPEEEDVGYYYDPNGDPYDQWNIYNQGW